MMLAANSCVVVVFHASQTEPLVNHLSRRNLIQGDGNTSNLPAMSLYVRQRCDHRIVVIIKQLDLQTLNRDFSRRKEPSTHTPGQALALSRNAPLSILDDIHRGEPSGSRLLERRMKFPRHLCGQWLQWNSFEDNERLHTVIKSIVAFSRIESRCLYNDHSQYPSRVKIQMVDSPASPLWQNWDLEPNRQR